MLCRYVGDRDRDRDKDRDRDRDRDNNRGGIKEQVIILSKL